MKRFALLASAMLFAGILACSPKPAEDWSDMSEPESRRSAAFVEQQMEAGMSESEARRAFIGQEMIVNTRGQRALSITADELPE